MRRILIVDDHEVVRDGIKRIFDEQTNQTIFGEASSAPEALKLARERDWDLAVLDLTLGDRSGLEVLKGLRQICPALPVLILSMHSEEQYARTAFKAGAAGYITKDSRRTELAEAMDRVIGGGRYVSPALAEKLVISLQRGIDRPLHETLSEREFQVMKLIGSGKTVGEIAEILSLSDKTISTYRARILQKLSLKNNAELIHYALQNKLAD
jgi:DNA-binding NarL/FixJ family response regulator